MRILEYLQPISIIDLLYFKMTEYLKNMYSGLTPEQIDAVKFPIDKALKIVAGAGTGKTTVLAYRYLHLVLERNINPENILALTFTKKAAFNLKKKVSEVIGNDYLMLKANIYNFDSFWLRLIFENTYISGIDSNFKIMDNTDRRILRDEIINEMIKNTDRDFILNLKNINLTDIRGILLNGFEIIEKAKIKLLDKNYFNKIIFEKIEQYKEEFGEDGNYETEFEYAELYLRLYNNYQKKIVEKKVLDFSDILLNAYYLLKDNPNIAGRYRKKFRYILIDEMQDTSFGQFEILKLLSEDNFKNVTVVGDDKQSIFGWRDAEIENIRVFSGEEKFLKENHRSYNEILDLANFTIFQDPYFFKKRKFLEIKNYKKGYKDETATKIFYSDNREDEAEFVANEIIKLSNEGVSLNDIALLFRSKTYPRVFEEVFREKGIPFCSIGGGYFDREEIKDVIAYLKILENPFDIPSLIRILENAPYPLNLDAMMRIGTIIKELKERYEGKEEFMNVFTIFENILNN
ncbi:MAG: UvrD-helicase domain-containing protein, partial [Candidatus Helarchaeota archaeon]|nr:UvrD-helicase domain-containing protein [Candidatus Helarchaeota archaeon]